MSSLFPDSPETEHVGANIPDELLTPAQWVVWRRVTREGGEKTTKLPVNPRSGRNASATNPADWSTFGEAITSVSSRRADGVGFVFTANDPYVGIDLDGCREPKTGRVARWAQAIIDIVDSYTEISPSGAGVHIIARGKLPAGRRRKGQVEMYDTGRYFTMTGRRLDGTSAAVNDRSEVIVRLHAEAFGQSDNEEAGALPAIDDDERRLRRAMASKNGGKFRALWQGDISGYESQSEADLALCDHLVFRTGGDPERVDRLFRRSGLMRSKWDEFRGDRTYGQITIETAIGGASDRHHAVEGPRRGVRDVPADPNAFPLTDAGNAELFADLHGDWVRYDHGRGRWLLWKGHRWAPDRDGEVVRLAKDAARTRYHAAADIGDTDRKTKAIQWARRSESRSSIDACLKLARSEHPIAEAGDRWDADPWIVGVRNGAIDLRTGALRPGRRDDRITMQIPVDFDADAVCPRWERFLGEVFCEKEELIDFIHRACGYCLTGKVDEQVFFLCHGDGANGKSVFLNTLGLALGDYAINLPFSTLELSQRASIPHDLAQLVGRRLATSSETNAGTRLNEARMKMLTGGDPTTARHLYRDLFTFKPSAKFWLAVNHPPAVSDYSHGYWRRVRVIPFPRTFGPAEADHDLIETLKHELPGIVAWAVRGCLAWRERGLPPPSSVTTATEDYREDADDITRFLNECCVLRPSATATPTDLHHAYLEWAKREGIPDQEKLKMKAFGARLKSRFEQSKSGSRRFYRGIGLTADATTE